MIIAANILSRGEQLPTQTAAKPYAAAQRVTPIEWLYKAAPGRKSEIVIPQDADSNRAGLFPIGLSASARERGWDELVKVPVQRWKSSELESFLQEDFYGNHTYREVIAEPLSFICVIPFLALYIAVMIRQELAGELRGLYEELYGVEFTSDLECSLVEVSRADSRVETSSLCRD